MSQAPAAQRSRCPSLIALIAKSRLRIRPISFGKLRNHNFRDIVFLLTVVDNAAQHDIQRLCLAFKLRQKRQGSVSQ